MNSNSNQYSESLGIIFREKETIPHTKGINKILLYKEDQFFTGGRDSVIKLWQKEKNENHYEHLYNFEYHIDWINDLEISRDKELLFSCSNDKTIGIWRIPQTPPEETNKTQSVSIPVHNIHKDYIKALSYSPDSNILFSCGFDGVIAQYDIEEMKKGNVFTGNETVYSQAQNTKNSYYSLSCDSSGRLLVASMYENVSLYKFFMKIIMLILLSST